MDPATLIKASKSYGQLKQFVETGELARTLGTIGDVATKAALASLRNADFAADPRREIASTITHLQSAHAAYESIWQGDGYSSYSDYLNAVANDRRVLLLMVLAYQYVGERPLALRTLALLDSFEKRFLKRYVTTIVRHPVHTGKRSMSAYLSPIRSGRALIGGIKGELSDDQLAELRAGIETMALPVAT
jgi:hypothetical protein